MGRNSTRTPRLTRSEKLRQERMANPKIDNSIEYKAPEKMPKFDPANQNQRSAKTALDEGCAVNFLVGSAGTGKTMLAAYRASYLLRSKQIDKIYIVRPAVSVGKTSGFLPGTLEEKLMPFFAPLIGHFEYFLGKGFTTYNLEKKIIELKAVEYTRGTNFSDCVVIVDESQNLTREEFQMMLTRIGSNCQIIFTGDTAQHDLKGQSGLTETLALLSKIMTTHPVYMDHEDMDELDEGINITEFKPADVVRSGITKAFVKIYYNN